MKKISITVDGDTDIENAIDIGRELAKGLIIEKLQSPKFILYMSEKLKNALNDIANTQVSTIISEALSSNEKYDYLSGMGVEITDNKIILYNNSIIDVSTKKLKDSTRANYPLQLPLGQIIEYGIGYTGDVNTKLYRNESWQYDVNEHGYKGWYYEDSQGNIHWTNGFAGRLVFYRLCLWLEENAKELIYNYLKN